MSRLNTYCCWGIVVLMVAMLTGTAAWAQSETDGDAPVVAVEVMFGTDVDRAARAIVGQTDEFAADGFSAEEGRVFCLTRIQNLEAPVAVTHVWYREGKTMARVELTVGSSDWRTWSSKRVLPAWTGNWEVKVLDANGMVLASAGFTVN